MSCVLHRHLDSSGGGMSTESISRATKLLQCYCIHLLPCASRSKTMSPDLYIPQRRLRPILSDITHAGDVRNLPVRLHVQSAPTLHSICVYHRVCRSRRCHCIARHCRQQRLLFNPASGPSWDLTYYVDQRDEDGRDPLMEHLARTKSRLLVDCDERTSPALTHHEKPSRMPDPASPLAEEQSSARVTTTRSGANR
jgi:hypothetical protein